jgi:hypothetical protein
MAEGAEPVTPQYDIVYAKMYASESLETLTQSQEISEEAETIRLLTEAIRDIDAPQYDVYATS